MKKEQRLYTSKFWLLCWGSLFFSASYNMLIPELPGYLSGLGGSQYIGFIIALFTLTAGVSRPFSGVLTDKIGRKPVMVFGALVCVLCGWLYPVLASVSGFLLLRLLHGFSTGFTPTAISAYVADVVPSNRWGEAFGIQGLFFTGGLAIGPAVGSTIKLYYSYDVLFYSSCAMAAIAILLIFRLKETLEEKHRFTWSMLRISKNDIIAPAVKVPAIATFLVYFSFGMVLTLIPDWSAYLGFENKGSFFIAFTLASLSVRFVAGKASDRYGRKKVTLVGLVILLLALFIMGAFSIAIALILGALLYGFAMGILSPALNAWTVDLSPDNEKGKGIATMFIALEAGIGLGALFSGWYYNNTYENIPMTMYFCAVLAIIGFFFIFLQKREN